MINAATGPYKRRASDLIPSTAATESEVKRAGERKTKTETYIQACRDGDILRHSHANIILVGPAGACGFDRLAPPEKTLDRFI